jgi:hypothetical protein
MGRGKLKRRLKKVEKAAKRQRKAVKLAMDCTWNEESRTLRNKDEPERKKRRVKEKLDDM